MNFGTPNFPAQASFFRFFFGFFLGLDFFLSTAKKYLNAFLLAKHQLLTTISPRLHICTNSRVSHNIEIFRISLDFQIFVSAGLLLLAELASQKRFGEIAARPVFLCLAPARRRRASTGLENLGRLGARPH